jgi:hypothetical protein
MDSQIKLAQKDICQAIEHACTIQLVLTSQLAVIDADPGQPNTADLTGFYRA